MTEIINTLTEMMTQNLWAAPVLSLVAGILTFFIGRVLMKKNIRERLGFTYDFSD